MDRRNYLKRSGICIAGIYFSGSIIAFLESCKTLDSDKSKFKLLTEKDGELLAAISDMIIPPTDTPGASDINAAKRIDETLYFNFELPDQQSFIDGLQNIGKYIESQYAKKFSELSQEQKEEVMLYLVQDANNHKGGYIKHVYPLIKGLTIISYFTSDTIAKKLLVHDPIPGVFEGDIPYNEVGGIWSINIMDS